AQQVIPAPPEGESRVGNAAPAVAPMGSATAEQATPDTAAPPPAEAHPVSLTEEGFDAAVQEVEEDGRTVYLNSMREETRKGAGVLHLLRVKLKNQKAALAGQPMLPEPPVAPNSDSDESLRLF